MGILEVLILSVENIGIFFSSLKEPYKTSAILLIHVLFMVLYSIIIWKFHKFLASREIIKLNLKKYNKSKNPELSKFLAIILFSLEYLIILPFIVLLWYGLFSLFIFILSESINVNQILLLTAAVIVSIRVTSYIDQSLSKDLAKLFPLTILAYYFINPNFLKASLFIERLSQIPSLLNNIILFLAMIILIEFALRGIYSIIQLIKSDDEEE